VFDVKRIAAVPLVWVAVLFAVASPISVSAHAEPERAEPPMSGVVHESPKTVEIWFGEEIAKGTTAEVYGPGGQRVDTGNAEIDLFDPERKHLTVSLKPSLTDGTYEVRWSSISAEDGDEATGTYTFTIEGVGTPTASPVASPITSPIAATPEASPTTTTQEADNKDSTGNWLRFLAAIGAGALAAVLIYGFWLLVKPRNGASGQNDSLKR
jgi:methionine-rich copper-binding protein CopC